MPSVIIIGGGAAGLMAAGTALKNGVAVTVIEHMPRPARKVMITGKGRCNVTNNSTIDKHIAACSRNGKFLFSALSQFSPTDTINLFESLGVPLKTERGDRVFPQSDKAVDIVDALVRYTKGAKILTSTKALGLIVKNGSVAGVKTDIYGDIFADAVILATGGSSYHLTGSDGSGYKLAEDVGHTVTELEASLVPLNIHEGFCSVLQGLSLKNVSLKIFKEGAKKPIYLEMGEMMFTHFGITGPLVLSASAFVGDCDKTAYQAVIDLKPALDEKALDNRILRDFSKFSNRDIVNALDELLPKKLIPIIINLAKIDLHKKVNALSREDRANLLQTIKSLKLTIVGKRPIEEAIITRGGVKISQINPTTMESKIINNLFFAGEIIDVDSFTGGFNLQIAFSTGYLAGNSFRKENEL